MNSDFTILFGIALSKNPRLKKIELSNLNLYDVDIQVLVANIPKLTNLQKISFKRSTFMDKISNLDKVLSLSPCIEELNLNMTNILT